MGIAIAFHWENRDLLLAYVSEALVGFWRGKSCLYQPYRYIDDCGPTNC